MKMVAELPVSLREIFTLSATSKKGESDNTMHG